MGSGGSRGLQNRCFGAEASKGWFDSDTPPPAGVARASSAPDRGLPSPRRQDAGEPAGWKPALRIQLLRRIRQEPDLLRARGVRRVHRFDCAVEGESVLRVDEHDALVLRTREHLLRDRVA